PVSARENNVPAPVPAAAAPIQVYAAPAILSAPAAPVWQSVAGKVVILDAGHGGRDFGAVHFGMREKDITLALALRTAAILQAQGATVHLTRQSDVFVPLPQRSAFANRYPDAVLVSIHVNASATNPNAFGIETFVLSGESNDAARGQAAASRYRLAGSDPAQSRREVTSRVAHSRNQGPVLAKFIQSSLAGRLGEPDRGVKSANFAVLRETYFCTAVLVEVGFISHFRTAERMRTEDWRRRCSEGLAAGIVDFLRRPQ
ncbi:MAG: N-acetylmuramoyl-L-alanine amidase, partial [Planctomycetes bacterium]|nr:N-acetylmuramoyl-L-alanine amidase [Planctomycetota bacterium]